MVVLVVVVEVVVVVVVMSVILGLVGTVIEQAGKGVDMSNWEIGMVTV